MRQLVIAEIYPQDTTYCGMCPRRETSGPSTWCGVFGEALAYDVKEGKRIRLEICRQRADITKQGLLDGQP